jgi:hypothetical protein
MKWLVIMAVFTISLSGLTGCRHPQKTTFSKKETQKYGNFNSMYPICSKIVVGDNSVSKEIEKHALVEKMSEGMKQVTFTPQEFASAAFSPQPDSRFSFERLRKNKKFIKPLAMYFEKNHAKIVKDNLISATRFLAVKIEPSFVNLNLVCGSPWDAFVLIFDKPEIFFDLGFHSDQPLEKAVQALLPIMQHELWHMAFIEHQKVHWPVDYRNSQDPAEAFLFRMLNEGVGHYYSIYNRLYPKVSYQDFSSRSQKIFFSLESKYQLYADEEDLKIREQILWSSHAQVPFWEKWGAIPGALVIYHLEQTIGAQGIKKLINSEPFSVFLAYDEQSKLHKDWPRLPLQLIDDARRALANHRSLGHGSRR